MDRNEIGGLLMPPAIGVLEAGGKRAESGMRVFADGEMVEERFRIVRFLGAGGMGEVYEAEDQMLGEVVALKTVRLDKREQARVWERLKRELLLARRVTHANVCRIYDLFHTVRRHGGDTLFLTMEMLRGETLAERVERQGRLPAEEALPLVRQMATAMHAAHQAGVIHRDFKPGNVMLCGAEGQAARAVLTDFGLSLNLSHGVTSQSTEGLVPGTPLYMAPEQLMPGESCQRSDIYALGMVMFYMLTGKVPHAEVSPMALALLKIHRDAPLARRMEPSVPREWEAVIARCLARRPEDRFQTAEEVLRGLQGGYDEQWGPIRRGSDSARRWASAAVARVRAACLAPLSGTNGRG